MDIDVEHCRQVARISRIASDEIDHVTRSVQRTVAEVNLSSEFQMSNRMLGELAAELCALGNLLSLTADRAVGADLGAEHLFDVWFGQLTRALVSSPTLPAAPNTELPDSAVGRSDGGAIGSDPLDLLELRPSPPASQEWHAADAYLTSMQAAVWSGTRLPVGGDFPFEPRRGDHGKPKRLRGGQGWIDKHGNRWVPDRSKPWEEWDVQHPDGTHTNVDPDGNITHGEPATRSGVSVDAAHVGAGITLGVAVWWGLKVLSPLCGPAAPACFVAL